MSTSAEREAFLRLSQGRLDTALKAISLLGNLHRASDYEWTPGEVLELFRQIEEARITALARFTGSKRWAEAGGQHASWSAPAPAEPPKPVSSPVAAREIGSRMGLTVAQMMTVAEIESAVADAETRMQQALVERDAAIAKLEGRA